MHRGGSAGGSGGGCRGRWHEGGEHAKWAAGKRKPKVLKDPQLRLYNSLPEFMSFKLFGRTILVVQKKFGLFGGHPLGSKSHS